MSLASEHTKWSAVWVIAIILTLACSSSSDEQRRARSAFQDSDSEPAPIPRKVTPEPEPGSGKLIDIPAIAQKTEGEILKILGAPTGRTNIQDIGATLPMCTYCNGEVEVVFVNGRADWITYYPPTMVPYKVTALTRLGLPYSRPEFESAYVIRWRDIAGLKEVSIFSTDDGHSVRYCFICVRTCP